MQRLRFRPHQHIKRGRDFDRAFREGSRARSAALLVVVVENGLEHTRLGLSVGKSVWKRAVKRNRLRRLFREAFRLSQAELPPGVDIVLIPGARQLRTDLETVRRDLVHLARKAWRRQQEKRASAAEASPATPAAAPAPTSNPEGSPR